MSSAVADVQLVAPAKTPKKRAKPQKKTKTRPTVSVLILQAAAASTERRGMSLFAVKKALKAERYDVVKNKARIIAAIKRLVASKYLVQTKGTGASGSFRLNKKPPTPKKKKVVKKRKPKAKKAKKASPKKAAAKKSPKKKKTTKSPKKAKRPATPKKPKKPKSPKKVKRNVAKSTRTRATAKK